MSTVVFWLTPEGRADHAEFAQAQLVEALKCGEERRRQGLRHVCVSSEFADRVGRSGVDAVEQGRLPSGEPYRFSKAHRGAGPAPGEEIAAPAPPPDGRR
jgi:hypothetical protein